MSEIIQNQDYKKWLIKLKSTIKQRQIKAAVAVNSQLIQLYWELGKQIVEKQAQAQWGSGFIDQLSRDLKAEFPDMGGFSAKNLRYCRAFYNFYLDFSIWQQLVAKLKIAGNQLFNLPWGHHVMIIQKIKNHNAALFYINQTIENNWSRAVLEYQIETNLYQRQGKAITNFKTTMPEIDSDLANALLKDSYNFEFLTLSGKVKELELEQKLIDNITHFLLELGKGFAYLGRQFEINVGGEIFKTDLLFYHTKLKCYVVIELKVTKFKPEYVGKLNFYITAIDRLVKDNTDKPTIGILLCKSKNNVVVDFALHDINKPLGVSEYTYKQLPENLKNSLPSVEQIENELNKFDDE
jgi:predicted nuclease of restriction endonuclease-like (RecB) superfamily